MKLYKEKYRVEPARLTGWDYSLPGWYYVTVCTLNRVCCLGYIADEKMHLSTIGKIVAAEWRRTEEVRSNVGLDEWTIMPNHIHGIIEIREDDETPHRGVSTILPSRLTPNSLGSIIGQFKSVCTKRIRRAGFARFDWQARFFDQIIETQEALDNNRQYIKENPMKWKDDEYNPENS